MVATDLHVRSVVRIGGTVVEDARFDDMTRVLGQQSGRRSMFKAAAGGVLGLVGLSALSDGVLAKCKNNSDCKDQFCVNKKCVECKSDQNCSNGFTCNQNKCVKTCKGDS